MRVWVLTPTLQAVQEHVKTFCGDRVKLCALLYFNKCGPPPFPSHTVHSTDGFNPALNTDDFKLQEGLSRSHPPQILLHPPPLGERSQEVLVRFLKPRKGP